MPKTSKFFRVATEGATTDGRVISREWLTQMAKNFNPAKYGARVWLEHMRGLYADSALGALGDVTAVECRQVEDGKLALFAQIKPLPALIDMNKKGQKIYTSIEVHPKFADSGEAYLTGLAVTDSPASLGTEVLAFAAQHPGANPFAQRKSHPDALFSAAVETVIEFEDNTDEGITTGVAAKFAATLKDVLAKFNDKFNDKGPSDDTRFFHVLEGFKQFGEHATQQAQAHSTLAADHAKLAKDFAALQSAHTGLVKTLENSTASHHAQRPAASGAGPFTQTDC